MFDINYKKWLDQSWEEFKDSEFYSGEHRDDVEICEDGTVYIGGLAYIKDCITPWEDSKFFVHW